MKRYIPSRERINHYLRREVLNNPDKNEFDYYQLVNTMQVNLGYSKKLIEDVIKTLIELGKLVEIRMIKVSSFRDINKNVQEKIKREVNESFKSISQNG